MLHWEMNIILLLVAKTILKTFLLVLSLIGTGPRRLLSCAMRLTPCGSALALSNVAFPLFYPCCGSPRKGATHQSVLGHQTLPGTCPLSPGPLSRSLVSPDTFCGRGTVTWFSQYLRLPTSKLPFLTWFSQFSGCRLQNCRS